VLRYLPSKHQKILHLSIPAVVNSLLDMLQVITDLIMVGRLSAYAVAAVGLGLQSLMFMFAILTLFHVGTSALLSRFAGARRWRRASVGLSTLLRFALLVSLPAAVGWHFFSSQIYRWFGTAQQVVMLGDDYVQIFRIDVPSDKSFLFYGLIPLSN